MSGIYEEWRFGECDVLKSRGKQRLIYVTSLYKWMTGPLLGKMVREETLLRCTKDRICGGPLWSPSRRVAKYKKETPYDGNIIKYLQGVVCGNELIYQEINEVVVDPTNFIFY